MLLDPVAEEEPANGDGLAPAQSTARIFETLRSLGFEPVAVPLSAERIADWVALLKSGAFELAFNLCESVEGLASGEHLVAAAVELLGLPMTGARAATLLYCLEKHRCASVLRAHRLPVPEWVPIGEDDPLPRSWNRFPAIVKPAAEDASNGVCAGSVAHSFDDLVRAVELVRDDWTNVVVQEFVEGREVNMAIVGDRVLPASEIDFGGLPPDAPRIVSYAAKWDHGSPEYRGTRPVCPAPLDPHTVRRLESLALRAWSAMDGTGYARVDFRITTDGRPYIIDVNPNPDLSLDAGLFRQARAAGWSYETLIRSIVDEALTRPATAAEDHGDQAAADAVAFADRAVE